MKLKIIAVTLLLITTFTALNASQYENIIQDIMPFNLNIINDNCDKIEMTQPIYKKIKKNKLKVYGEENNFLITCNEENNIVKINFYKEIQFKELLLKKKINFEEIYKILNGNFNKHQLNVTDGIEYKILEVFVNNELYQIIVFNKEKKEIEFISFINMKEFPEYKYIGKMKNKADIPPLITWLFI